MVQGDADEAPCQGRTGQGGGQRGEGGSASNFLITPDKLSTCKRNKFNLLFIETEKFKNI